MPFDSPNLSPPRKWLDSRELLRAVLHGWFTVILVACGTVAYEVYVLHHAETLYQAQMQVTSTQSSESDTSNRFASFAQAANLALPAPQTGSNYRYYIDSLTSRDIADVLAKNPKIMHAAFADQWDEATQTWREPAPARITRIRNWVFNTLDLPSPQWHPPDGESLLYFVTGSLQLIQDPRKTYITKVLFNFGDRQFAVDFLNQLNTTADTILRQKELQRTAQNIAYLTKVLVTTTIAEHRIAIAQALSDQEKSAMLARSDSPFAAELFERPWVSSLPSYPRPFQSLVTAGIFGLLLGAVAAVIQWNIVNGARRWLRQRRTPRGPAGPATAIQA